MKTVHHGLLNASIIQSEQISDVPVSAPMEWGYRLLQEPKRLWRRYLIGNVVFLARLAQVWAAGNVQHGAAG
jgi:hypothetical protein